MKKNNSLISLIKINKKSLEDVLDLLDKIENETYCKSLKIIDDNSGKFNLLDTRLTIISIGCYY